ncbi:G-protein beta WD-40 repeat-containing protein [Artemisia annua]|uniref:G-protein beta WD-40 repeat-containing protein n=1 Tax=Artemisia annua TaxID=35608 RepID=A0A2U1L0G9_ARTAN|nr:G-protein beta WD-40 repeat-containing protein [Artemisia annua]
MHRVGIAGSASNSVRPRKEKRFTYVLNDADDNKHCAGVNCLAVLKPSQPDNSSYLFTGSRDGTLKRWELGEEDATCSATFESHVDWVNDAVLAGGNTLVSCSSDTTIKTWDSLSNGTCTRTFRQHSDYVTCLAAAERNSNIVASGGMGGEVFLWDLEAALAPLNKSSEAADDDRPSATNGSGSSVPVTSLRTISSSNSISLQANVAQGYVPIAAKGHKESVYALAMNETGNLLVSGGTEKAIRVWDSRTGSKMMKLRGHTDNIRALLLDPTGRFCLSGSSDSMIRLWDLGQQRCVHSYAVHTDSVWALASTPTFSHVYSGGRDLSLYLTDLATRESILLCTEEHPIQKLAVHGDDIWVATTDSSVHRWPAEGRNPQKVFHRGGSFLAGNLSFSRARASLEGSTPVPVYKEPTLSIDGIPGIVRCEIMNNRRHVLTKDNAGSVKLWEITRGVCIQNYGPVSFEKKKEELFEMVSIPAWFSVDSKLGNLSVHLDTPQCFSAEMYSADLNITEKAEDDKVNLARETLKGLLAHWLSKKKHKPVSQSLVNGEIPSGRDISTRSITLSKVEADGNAENDCAVYPPFEFSTVTPPSIITEGSHNGQWRKKITEMDGTEDEKDLPWWVLDCILHNRMPPREHTKCSFYLQPYEGSTAQTVTQGKLSAPRILRIHKVVNYVVEKLVLDKPLDSLIDGPFAPGLSGGQLQQSTIGGDGSFRSGLKPWQKLKPSIEILCNNQVLTPDMSLATVRTYIWKKSEDLVLNYRIVPGR